MGYFSELDIEMDAVIEAVEVNYNFEDVIKRGEKSALSFFFENTEGLTEITIFVEADSEEIGHRQGIHLTQGFENAADRSFRIGDALSSCFRNGFDTIYIHKEAA